MPFIMNCASKILDTNKNFIFVNLDSCNHHAGDRIKGRIFLNIKSNFPDSRLVLTSLGYENLTVITASHSISEYKNEIFHNSSIIQEWEFLQNASQYIFPFSFKLPFYAPATFEFDGFDQNNNNLKASIEYYIKAALIEKDSVVLEDEAMFSILSNKARQKPQESKLDIRLKTCCCLKKGNSHINLSQVEKINPSYGSLCRFNLQINWEKYKGKIREIKGTILYKLYLTIPGDRTYEYSKQLFDFNHSQSFLNNSDSVVALNEFDVLIEGQFGENASSNSTAMIHSTYEAEAEIEFTFNVSHQHLKIQLPVYVNPKTLLDKEYSIKGEWSPESFEIRSVYLQTKAGQNIFSPSNCSLISESLPK